MIKKTEEQHFIDSILTKFCTVDTVFLPIDTLQLDRSQIDSLNLSKLTTDSLFIEVPKIETK